MEKLKQYSIIIALAIIAIGFVFYWYEWRPISLRSECAHTTLERAKKLSGPDYEGVRIAYELCIHERGLEN